MIFSNKHECIEYSNIYDFYLYRFHEQQKYSQQNNINNAFLKSDIPEHIRYLCINICDDIILKYILSVLTSKEHHSLINIRLDQLFIDFYTIDRNYNFFNSVKSNIENHAVSLRENGFLAFPWKKDSLAWMFNQFRKENFIWHEDYNHSITLIKPFNIYFVNGGNHSIACGKFFNLDGKIQCDTAIDYSNILKEYNFNGKYFTNKYGRNINKPFFKELSSLFLLGKALVDLNSDLPAA
jgi:hypothetical protein